MTKEEEKPLFTHDCTCCTFLGTFDGRDLYHHGGEIEPTLIARWGSDGPEYTSGIVFAAPFLSAMTGKMKPGNPWLVEAKKRAEEKGLSVEEKT